MVYALYGLNKIGAAPLIIDPRTSAAGAMSFIKETGAKIFIVIDLYYEVLKDALFESGVEKIVVISADTSLPKSIRFLKQFKMPAPKIATSDKVLTWTQALRRFLQARPALFEHHPDVLFLRYRIEPAHAAVTRP